MSTVLLPAGWPRPRGYSNGIKASGEMVFVAGQVGWDESGKFSDGFVAQVRRALENIVAVLESGGARPEHITRMRWFVTDMDTYRDARREVGEVYRDVIGRHYPAMSLIAVTALDEQDAYVEIEATAVITEA